MKYVVDTYALVWFLEGNSRLGTNARSVLSDVNSQLVLPAIALAEAAWIVERGRTSISSVTTLLSAIHADQRVIVHALDNAVIGQSVQLTTIHEMHDRQIVATALVIQEQGEIVTLLTCDQNITASGLVKVAW